MDPGPLLSVFCTMISRLSRLVIFMIVSQGLLLDELDQDMDTTQSRLKATQKKMQVSLLRVGIVTLFLKSKGSD